MKSLLSVIPLLLLTTLARGQTIGTGAVTVFKSGAAWHLSNNTTLTETAVFTQPDSPSETVTLKGNDPGSDEGSASKAEKTFYCSQGAPTDEKTRQPPTYGSESAVCGDGQAAGVDEQSGEGQAPITSSPDNAAVEARVRLAFMPRSLAATLCPLQH